MEIKHLQSSPCEGCSKVADTAACDNKTCGLWRKWFNDRWNFVCGAVVATAREE